MTNIERLEKLKEIQDKLDLNNKDDIIRYSVCENIKKLVHNFDNLTNNEQSFVKGFFEEK